LNAPEIESEIPGFRRPEALVLLLAGNARTMKARSLLCQEGKRTDRFFVITEGEVEIEKSIAGKRCALATSGPGSVLALMAALDGAPCPVSLRALGRAKVVEITRRRLLALLDGEAASDSGLAHEFALVAIRRLRDATDELAQALCHALRSSPRAGKMDARDLARIQAGNHAWPCVMPGA
jgi:CRP-like cAMP-binding protein